MIYLMLGFSLSFAHLYSLVWGHYFSILSVDMSAYIVADVRAQTIKQITSECYGRFNRSRGMMR